MNENSGKKQKKASTGRAYTAVFVICICMFLGLISYLIYFQVVMSEDLNENPYNVRIDVTSENVVRGSILAADGTVLAGTETDEEGNENRVYPYGSLFAQTVGYSDYGASGLESTQNKTLLKSSTDLVSQVQDALNETKHIGDNVITTLRVDVQQAARDALGDHQGAVIVMDRSSGAVLADVSTPDFDPNTVAENWESLSSDESGSPFLNRPLQGLYAPGSTFKIVTTLAYLREYGSFDDFHYTCGGEYSQGGFTIHCNEYTAHGEETLEDAFANSCNCAYAYMAAELLDRSYLLETAEDLGFNREMDLDIAYYPSSYSVTQDTDLAVYMQTAIGQGDTQVTPMQMAMIAQAVANGGDMTKPCYVSGVNTYDGENVSTSYVESLGQVMTAGEAEELTTLMKAVVARGTASNLSGLPYDIAGKTGSAQYGDVESGNTHSWFVGFSNTGQNDIVVAVLVENGYSLGAYASDAAGAIFQSYFGG